MVAVLHGTPYEMGLQHGMLFKNRIHSLYTTLLTSSLLPYLNREQPDIASAMALYNGPKYADDKFSYEFLMDSAKSLEKYIPSDLVQEMHGVAEGSGMTYDRILLLNMLMDAMFNMRSITFFIKGLQAPHILKVEFLTATGSPLDNDGLDNDSDGKTDEKDEGIVDPDDPSPWALMTEVPPDGMVRFTLEDQVGLENLTAKKPKSPEGVDPKSIRLQWNRDVLNYGAPGLNIKTVTQDGKSRTIVTFQPPGGFAKAAVVSLQIQAGDKAWITNPPPGHAHIMRDERVVFTTRGYGKPCWQVPNQGDRDPRTQPPSIAFAVRGKATTDNILRLAQHFAMLDSNTLHKHTVVFFCKPKQGKPFMYVGWTGVIWGFSGMNSDGLAYTINLSDTLNNGMVKEILKHITDLKNARMQATGVPAGIMGRILLSRASTVDEAKKLLHGMLPSYGWNFLLADAKNGMAAVEVNQDILNQGKGFASFTVPPVSDGDKDPHGRPWASVGMDDIRIASHAIRLADDLDVNVFGLLQIKPQRFWTSFYFRSLRAFYILGTKIRENYGNFDVPAMIRVLRTDALVDHRDSMNAVIYEPSTLKAYVASGTVPATAGNFNIFDLGDPATWVIGGAGAVDVTKN